MSQAGSASGAINLMKWWGMTDQPAPDRQADMKWNRDLDYDCFALFTYKVSLFIH